MKYILFIFAIFYFAQNSVCQTSKPYRNESKSFQKGIKLGRYYPLDSIKIVILNNWKGKHTLTKKSKQLFISQLKSYTFSEHNAHTKPGHLWCMITFLNGTTFYFDSNSESEIIISNVEMGDNTFLSSKKINFEKF